jgi:squalene-associated FAD-dependent desaturase
VAVIGAGWAGLSAASRLALKGHSVTLFEAARQLGGRARAVDWKLADGRHITLDNGQHILQGAYRETLELMRLCGIDCAAVLLRQPVRLEGVSGFALRAWPLPAPWHLLFALVSARGLEWRARADMARLMVRARRNAWHLEGDRPVAQWLHDEGQSDPIVTKVWAPLCVAALNTPIAIASAQVFLNVLRDSLGATRAASDLLLPRAPLDALLPVACARLIEGLGGRVNCAARVIAVQALSSSVDVTSSGGATESFDAAVLAVPGHQVGSLLDTRAQPELQDITAQCAGLTWQPITTVYAAYPPTVRLPAPMIALDERTQDRCFGQWVFDKSQLGGPEGLLAVVISAQGPHQELEQDAVSRAVLEQLRVQLGLRPEALAVRVISEKRATFACLPNLARPAQRTARERLVLAGDFTESDYPATLETAVASGHAAARLVDCVFNPS